MLDSIGRRAFIKTTALAAAAAGAVIAVPGAAGAAARHRALRASQPEGSDGPLVAHVRNARSGEIALFTGARRVTVRDPELAARLLEAAR
jgi:hypothetical protein